MQKGDTLKFLEGAVAGLALGIAASMFLSSKTGKALKKEVKDTAADFYEYIAPKLKKIKKMSEAEYKEFMRISAQKYGELKKLSEDKISELVQEAQKSWHHFF